MKKIINFIKRILEISYYIVELKDLKYEEYYSNLKNNSFGLNIYERKVYSQHGEDGIINEIFKRIGTKNKFFFEFGAGTKFENNSLYLLINGWSGVWVDGDEKNYKFLINNFKNKIIEKKLKVSKDIITSKNINEITTKLEIPNDLDFLSIDVDGNDYYIWKSCNLKPKVLCIEYNASFLADSDFLDCERREFWTGGNYFGASIKKITELCNQKGYTLVATDLSGANAFFVLNEYKDKFQNNNDIEKLYNPPKYFLAAYKPITPMYKD